MSTKTKILYVGVYRNQSGYAKAASETILSLASNPNVDIVCRHYNLTKTEKLINPSLEKYENKTVESIDFTIQHVPPYCMEYCSSGGINIGNFYFETYPLNLAWRKRANMMDSLIFSCAEMKNNFTDKDSYVVPIPTDVSKYTQNIKNNIKFDFKNSGKYLFYTIGEFVERKNLDGLLRAYFAEFRHNEPVALIIKIGPKDKEKCINLVKEIAYKSKLKNIPTVHIIAEFLTELELNQLHQICDCFVQPSRAESWSIPAFDAMGFGKTVIVSNCGGYKEYIVDGKNGKFIGGVYEPVYNGGDIHKELFTCRQQWFSPNIEELRFLMRGSYKGCFTPTFSLEERLDFLNQFSYEYIGQQILKVLKDVKIRKSAKVATTT